MSAPEFFAKHYPNKTISKELQKLPEQQQVAWEDESVHPDRSPGPLRTDERVCRPLTSPTHFDQVGGTVKPTAFDDAANKGLSVDRLAFADLAAILGKADERAKAYNADGDKPEVREVIGHCEFAVSDLRAVLVQADGSGVPPRRGLGVYDTALDGEREHADVCQIAPNAQGGRSARSLLYNLAKSCLVRKSSP